MAGHSYASQQYYYNTPEIQHVNTLHVCNDYFASTTNSHVDVTRYKDNMHVVLVSHYSDNGFNYACHSFEKLHAKSHVKQYAYFKFRCY